MIFDFLTHAEYLSLVDLVNTDQFRVVRFTHSRRETSDWGSITETYTHSDDHSCVDIAVEKVVTGVSPSYENVHINFYDLVTLFGTHTPDY